MHDKGRNKPNGHDRRTHNCSSWREITPANHDSVPVRWNDTSSNRGSLISVTGVTGSDRGRISRSGRDSTSVGAACFTAWFSSGAPQSSSPTLPLFSIAEPDNCRTSSFPIDSVVPDFRADRALLSEGGPTRSGLAGSEYWKGWVSSNQRATIARSRSAANQGRAAPIRKRTSHITVVVDTKDV